MSSLLKVFAYLNLVISAGNHNFLFEKIIQKSSWGCLTLQIQGSCKITLKNLPTEGTIRANEVWTSSLCQVHFELPNLGWQYWYSKPHSSQQRLHHVQILVCEAGMSVLIENSTCGSNYSSVWGKSFCVTWKNGRKTERPGVKNVWCHFAERLTQTLQSTNCSVTLSLDMSQVFQGNNWKMNAPLEKDKKTKEDEVGICPNVLLPDRLSKQKEQMSHQGGVGGGWWGEPKVSKMLAWSNTQGTGHTQSTTHTDEKAQPHLFSIFTKQKFCPEQWASLWGTKMQNTKHWKWAAGCF